MQPELTGHPAFATYLGVHLYYPGGGVGRRVGVLTDWVTARSGHPQHQVVGGGATGVEVSGALALLAHDMSKRSFARIDPADARVLLFDAGERVVPSFSERLSAKGGRVPRRAWRDRA